MSAETKELTNFHLGRREKQALRELAAQRGTTLADEIRFAVDAYLAGVTPQQIELLDVATRQAQAAIEEMNQQLAATNRKAKRIFAAMAKLRGGYPEGTR